MSGNPTSFWLKFDEVQPSNEQYVWFRSPNGSIIHGKYDSTYLVFYGDAGILSQDLVESWAPSSPYATVPPAFPLTEE